MLVSNYKIYNQNYQHNSNNSKYINPPIHFNGGIKQSNKSNKMTTIGISTIVLGLAGLAGAKSKPVRKYIAKEITRPLERKICKNKVLQYQADSLEGVDLEKQFKEDFIERFIQCVKNPFHKIRTKDGKFEEKLDNFPPNGYLLTGPDSKAKEERFNWMLDELGKAGATIIDPGKGKKAKFNTVADAWWDMWNNHSDEEFKKTGKFKVFVVRGVDELGQPKGYPENHLKYPDGALLKDSPDSDSSCRKHGIMLFYTCRDAGNLDPATIRGGRVDVHFAPQPKDDEPIEIWKEYLDNVRNGYSPDVVVNKLSAAKEVLSKRGENVMKEMEPHFEYMVPYESPKATDSLKKWQKYVTKQSQNPNIGIVFHKFRRDIIDLHGNLLESEQDKLQTVLKMMEEAQKPEYKKAWKIYADCALNGEDPAYYL